MSRLWSLRLMGRCHFGSLQAKKIPRRRSCKDEINNYLAHSEFYSAHKNLIGSRLIEKKRTNPEALYLVDPTVADQIAKCLIENVDFEGRMVFEANPGFGLLTKKLLTTNLKKLNIFESEPSFRKFLKSVVCENPDRLKLVPMNIFLLWKAAYQDRLDNGTRVADIMEDVEKKNWEDDPVITLIGALPGKSFYRHILSSIIFQTGIIPYGRPELLILLNAQTYMQLKDGREVKQVFYKPDTVFFHLFFHSELLLRVNAKCFLPWQRLKTRPDPTLAFEALGYDPDELYLVKLCPKKNLYEILPREFLKPFWYFLKHLMTSRKNRVIPLMERWVPGSGRYLLRRSIGVFTEVGDLAPQDILELFLDFTSWPEFQSCPFLPAMETVLLKMEQPGNDEEFVGEETNKEK